MSKMLTAGLLVLALGNGAASAAPVTVPDVAIRTLPASPSDAKVKAWFERAIQHMLDEAAHVAQATGSLR